jgi:hypothetical protein
MGETRVDLQHLLEDLRDAYTGALEETILTEVVANALDSGATRVRLLTSPSDATLTIVDDGSGMQRRELARYHDIAASTKSRGEGIGFAGVGIKLGLLVSREVITETRRGATHVATRWHLASRRRAPWKWIQAPGFTESRGTAVQLILANQLSPLLDAGYLEETVRRHFEPLLDPMFDDLLRRYYRSGVVFDVDGRELSRTDMRGSEIVAASIKIGRRRTASATGFIERDPLLPADRAGIAISTFGKIIKRGWDWLGLTPGPRAHVGGLIEAPALAACLTLSKNDFIRTGTRGAIYLAYRKAIQEVVSAQLAQWGDAGDAEARPRTQRLERDLERVLEDLADEFPLLRSLVDRRAGGQKRLPMPGRGSARVPDSLFATLPTGNESLQGDSEEPAPQKPASDSDQRPDAGAATAGLDTILGRRRPARYGLLLQFESRPGDAELGRLVDSTIFINDAHPAFTRAVASRSIGYHTALAVALALAPLTVEPAEEHTFITHFLAHWGHAQTGNRLIGRRQRAGKKTGH